MNHVKKHALAFVLAFGTVGFSTKAETRSEPTKLTFHKKCGVYAAQRVAKPDCAGGVYPPSVPQLPVYHGKQVSQVTEAHRPRRRPPVYFKPRPVWDMHAFSWVCKDPGNSACGAESGPKGKRYLHVYLDYPGDKYDYLNRWSCQPVTNRNYRKCRKKGGYPLWNQKAFRFHCTVPPRCPDPDFLRIVNNKYFTCTGFGPLPPPIIVDPPDVPDTGSQ